MAGKKIFAGPVIKRLRRASAMTQAATAAALDISPSYLNLIERNQRPLSAQLVLRLAEYFDFDPRTLSADEPGGGSDAIARRLHDPIFADIMIEKSEINDWLIAAPNAAAAFARLFDKMSTMDDAPKNLIADPVQVVRQEIERWRNHFADLDLMAENLADEIRLGAGDLYGAIAERLRVKHHLMIRILPDSVLPGILRRLDIHARQLQLSEMLDPASRTFQAATMLAQIEAKDEIDALVAGAAFADKSAERFFRRHLVSYFAAALMMPYARFLRACEQTGYDIFVLQRRFGAGFEQVAHRLTTLQRVGARGLPFFMLRIDRAGVVSKRYSGASNAPLVDSEGRCPHWHIHHAFEKPAQIYRQLISLDDDSSWFTLSRSVQGIGASEGDASCQFVIGLGVAAEVANALCYVRGMDLSPDNATPVGLGCGNCNRPDCAQRSLPPVGRALKFDEQERGLTPYGIAGD